MVLYLSIKFTCNGENVHLQQLIWYRPKLNKKVQTKFNKHPPAQPLRQNQRLKKKKRRVRPRYEILCAFHSLSFLSLLIKVNSCVILWFCDYLCVTASLTSFLIAANKLVRLIDLYYAKLIPALKSKGITNVMSRKDWPPDVLKRVFLELEKETPRSSFFFFQYQETNFWIFSNSDVFRYNGLETCLRKNCGALQQQLPSGGRKFKSTVVLLL